MVMEATCRSDTSRKVILLKQVNFDLSGSALTHFKYRTKRKECMRDKPVSVFNSGEKYCLDLTSEEHQLVKVQ